MFLTPAENIILARIKWCQSTSGAQCGAPGDFIEIDGFFVDYAK